MKHSIRYIQFNYYQGTGRGKSIQIIRGMEVREYPYSDKNAVNLSAQTWNVGQWESKYYPTHIDVTRIYPKGE